MFARFVGKTRQQINARNAKTSFLAFAIRTFAVNVSKKQKFGMERLKSPKQGINGAHN
jgi:hypothetical protein